MPETSDEDPGRLGEAMPSELQGACDPASWAEFVAKVNARSEKERGYISARNDFFGSICCLLLLLCPVMFFPDFFSAFLSTVVTNFLGMLFVVSFFVLWFCSLCW